MRPSLVIFCCASLVAMAYAGINYPTAVWEAAAGSANQRSDLYPLSIPNLDLEHPPISEFQAISDRPIFTPSRRRTLAAATAQVQVFRLRGVLTVKSQKIALVERVDDGTLLRVSEGDILNDWQVSAIERNSISWIRLDRSHEMVVSEMWEQEKAPIFPDASKEDLHGRKGSNERANASSHFNSSRRHHAGARALPDRHLTDAGDYAPSVMPTEPPLPTPIAPRHPPMRRFWHPKGPA